MTSFKLIVEVFLPIENIFIFRSKLSRPLIFIDVLDTPSLRAIVLQFLLVYNLAISQVLKSVILTLLATVLPSYRFLSKTLSMLKVSWLLVDLLELLFPWLNGGIHTVVHSRPKLKFTIFFYVCASIKWFNSILIKISDLWRCQNLLKFNLLWFCTLFRNLLLWLVGGLVTLKFRRFVRTHIFGGSFFPSSITTSLRIMSPNIKVK